MDSLPLLSDEQNKILNLLENHNVITNSVAGSGKTTTNLHIANKFNTKKILLLTYNARLKIETRQRVIKYNLKNIEVQNYHSFCVKYYDSSCHNDILLKKTLEKNPKRLFAFDIILIDEAQDITSIYYELICKIYKDNLLESKICILGDEYQSIYQYKGADQRFITLGNMIFNFNNYLWTMTKLSTSYRITDKMADFVNECMIKEKRIYANKTSEFKPRYIICDTFGKKFGTSERTAEEVIYYLNKGYKPWDFFILAPSVKSNKTPVRILANYLSNEYDIKMHVPTSDEEKIDDEVIKGKMVFSTFHQVKGLERKVIIIFNFDNSYFKFYKKDENPFICTNDLYVGATRGLEHLTLFHHYDNNYLPFLDKEKLKKYCYVEGNDLLNVNEISINKNIDTAVNDLTRDLDPNHMEFIFNCFDVKLIQEKSTKIEIPTKVIQNSLCESVAELTGLAIPFYFENMHNGKITPLLNMQRDSKFEEINKIDKYNVNESDILVIANYWNKIKTGYDFKVNQINEYNWLSKENLDMCMNRLEKIGFSFKTKFEKKYTVEDEIILMNRKITGYIDCIDNDRIFEFKCTDEIDPEHFIQLAIYMYLVKYENNIKNFKFYLYNILTDEMYELSSDLNRLNKMIEYIIKVKYGSKEKIADNIFIENQIVIKNKFNYEKTLSLF